MRSSWCVRASKIFIPQQFVTAAIERPSGETLTSWGRPSEIRSANVPIAARAAQQRREERALGLRRAVEVQRLAGEQHRQVDARLRDGLGAELPAERDGRLVLRRAPLLQGDDAADDRSDEQHAGPDEESAQPSVLSALPCRLEIRMASALARNSRSSSFSSRSRPAAQSSVVLRRAPR